MYCSRQRDSHKIGKESRARRILIHWKMCRLGSLYHVIILFTYNHAWFDKLIGNFRICVKTMLVQRSNYDFGIICMVYMYTHCKSNFSIVKISITSLTSVVLSMHFVCRKLYEAGHDCCWSLAAYKFADLLVPVYQIKESGKCDGESEHNSEDADGYLVVVVVVFGEFSPGSTILDDNN